VTGMRVSWQPPCCLATATPSWSDTHLCQPIQQASTQQSMAPCTEHGASNAGLRDVREQHSTQAA
jgi:hypothetical protein